MTCSVQPRTAAISGFVFPSHTMVATCISFRLNCSRGDMQLLLSKHGGCQNDPLTPLLDADAQKQRAQVLFDCAWADVAFSGDLLIAAALHQQLQHLLVAPCDFDLLQV